MSQEDSGETPTMSSSLESPGAGASSRAEPTGGASGEALPMMVWLRGDEELCREFSLDAEEVMVQLGIRRSRLTQISGKELRVGRMRKGRYVSPVFRPADVEAYLSWTRASASHLKSSGVLHDAAGELMQQSERLSQRLEAVPLEMVDALGHEVAGATKELSQLITEQLGGLQREFHHLERALLESESRIKQVLHDQTMRQESLAAQLKVQDERLDALAACLKAQDQEMLARFDLDAERHDGLMRLLRELASSQELHQGQMAAHTPVSVAAVRRIKAAGQASPGGLAQAGAGPAKPWPSRANLKRGRTVQR